MIPGRKGVGGRGRGEGAKRGWLSMHAGLAHLEMEIRHLELGHNTIENRIIDVHPKFEVPIWEPNFPFLSFVE